MDNLISRLLWLVVQPSNFFFVLLLFTLLSLWWGRRKSALWALLTCVSIYGMVMFGPLVSWLMVPLEKQFVTYHNQMDQEPYSGIIVLAGAERLTIAAAVNKCH